jgi:hypothetical protein
MSEPLTLQINIENNLVKAQNFSVWTIELMIAEMNVKKMYWWW